MCQLCPIIRSIFAVRQKNYLKPNFKNVELLTKYPPFEQKISDINTNTILNHCFPNGFSLIESDEKPKDEFFHFNLDNLYNRSCPLHFGSSI